MNQDIVLACCSGLALSMVSFFMAWGAVRAKITDHAKRMEDFENEIAKQLELIHSLRDVYVSYKHFNEIMLTIRETQRELKDDMKKIIELLTDRA